ncbi:MAG: 3-methyl-2-oxobutanoate dehydrogenase subunit VorB [bacterium]
MEQEKKVLMEGNEVVAEAAIIAGCRYYFGYPITPQNEIPAYMSWRLPQVGGVFIQAESEIAAINMVFGAALTGEKAMTSSSSPGISLKQEGISYMAGCELPALIVNMNRSGPGLGGIQASQSDYFQSTKGGGHGDYRLIVFAPTSLQELMDLTILSFDLAFKYRNPVLILGDAILAQMKEPVILRKPSLNKIPSYDWTLRGALNRPPRFIKSLFLNCEDLEKHNLHLQEKYLKIEKTEIKYQAENIENAEYLVVAFGSCARIAKSAVKEAQKQGMKIGFIRPITVWPFPYSIIKEVSSKVKKVLVIEMNAGQMLEDVKLAVLGNCEVNFFGKMGGAIPTSQEILEEIKKIVK